MDIEGTVNNFKKSGYRNLSSSGEPSRNKIAKMTQKNITITSAVSSQTPSIND